MLLKNNIVVIDEDYMVVKENLEPKISIIIKSYLRVLALRHKKSIYRYITCSTLFAYHKLV